MSTDWLVVLFVPRGHRWIVLICTIVHETPLFVLHENTHVVEQIENHCLTIEVQAHKITVFKFEKA